MKTSKFKNIEVSAIGLGCIGFTHAYGDGLSEEEGIHLIHYAFEKGCRLFDTAEMYSSLKNEEFVGKAIRELPGDQIVFFDKIWPQLLPGRNYSKGNIQQRVFAERWKILFPAWNGLSGSVSGACDLR